MNSKYYVILAIQIFLFISLLNHSSAQIIVSEIMFDADTLENHNEYVEIYNVSTEGVDLTNWMIGDDQELDLIFDSGYGLLLQPNQFAVILDASYFLNSTIYDSIIPKDALIVTIEDNSFGNYGWSNTYPEIVKLVSPQGDTLQQYTYTIDNIPGYSDEKIILSEDNSSSNWGNSIIFRGSPGSINSISPLERDVLVDSVWIEPANPIENIEFSVEIIVRNVGINPISQFIIQIFEDLNNNGIPELAEIIIDDIFSDSLKYNDSTKLSWYVPGLTQGIHVLGTLVEIDQDQKPLNNIKLLSISVESIYTPIVINEVMFKPVSGFSEWIELFNKGNSSIILKNWMVADSRDTVIITNENWEIGPMDYCVICKDSTIFQQYSLSKDKVITISSFPTLNNDFDDLKIFSSSIRLIDRLTYTDDWMRRETEQGTSLERINPHVSSSLAENWAASVDYSGATPGRQNSIFVENKKDNSTISVYPNPFSPDSDGFEDYTIIAFKLQTNIGYISAEIYDIIGRLIRHLATNLPVGQNGELIWDGKDDNGRVARIGIYIILFRIFDSNQNVYRELKKTVVLAKVN
jgi:hypothetical protein